MKIIAVSWGSINKKVQLELVFPSPLCIIKDVQQVDNCSDYI